LLEEKSNIAYPPESFRVFGFHDDTVIATCRVGSGPNPDGGRHSNFIQISFRFYSFTNFVSKTTIFVAVYLIKMLLQSFLLNKHTKSLKDTTFQSLEELYLMNQF